MDSVRSKQLTRSDEMTPIEGAIDIDVPAAKLWELFAQAHLWPRWNRCFLWVHNPTLNNGSKLIWMFQPIKRWYLYKMPAVATIIELVPGRKVTWEVTALPGFYAHHTYTIDPLPGDRARFRSWEKAYGWSFRAMKDFWLAHFTFVKDSSLEGARFLQEVYRRDGDFEKIATPAFGCTTRDTALTVLSAAAPLWFFNSYVKLEASQLAPRVHAVLGGGSNSLVVEDGDEALLVDTKFPPGSRLLSCWVAKHVRAPITQVVNTHYHYDHTQGNELFRKATVVAHERVPAYMFAEDGDYWSKHQGGVPAVGVGDRGQIVSVGKKEVQLFYPGPAHTHGDLVVYVPADKILATGDLFFHTFYPFFDPSRVGVSLPGLIRSIRTVVARFPDTKTVVPGHGPLATLRDFEQYGQYLETLYGLVESTIQKGWSEDQAIEDLDLSAWKRKVLPSFHGGKLYWATRESNIRAVYRLTLRERAQAPAPANRGTIATSKEVRS